MLTRCNKGSWFGRLFALVTNILLHVGVCAVHRCRWARRKLTSVNEKLSSRQSTEDLSKIYVIYITDTDTEIYQQTVANLVFRKYQHFTQIDVCCTATFLRACCHLAAPAIFMIQTLYTYSIKLHDYDKTKEYLNHKLMQRNNPYEKNVNIKSQLV